MLMRSITLALAAVLSAASFAVSTVPLDPTDRHEAIAARISSIFRQSVYRRVPQNAMFSSRALDRYIEVLDPQRMYFLDEDIATFERYRDDLAVRIQSHNVDPGFDIFDVYRQRVAQRTAYATSFLSNEPDLTVEETFDYDRREAAWATSDEEMDDLWRRRLKNETINLLLSEQDWDEAAEVLAQRYRTRQRNIDQMTSDDVFEIYINAFAWIVDPHTSYLSPIASDEYQIDMSASVEGVGATLNIQDDYVTVVTVIPGGPAFIGDALHPDDRIVGVAQGPDGEFEDVIGWRLIDVVRLIRGPKGSVVQLRVLPAVDGPDAAPVDRALVRDVVVIEAARAASEIIEIDRDDGTARIGVITIANFYGNPREDTDLPSVSQDVERLVGELEEQGIDALLIDLRNNGGGYLTEVTRMAGLFIDSGPIVQTRYAWGAIDVETDPTPASTVYDGPLAVLVNRYSASATEIFAAAMQDYERGVILGQRTYGKGTIQQYGSLTSAMGGQYGEVGNLKFTMGKYYRVTGESTQNRGVIPDIELPSPIDETEVGESTWDSALPWDTIAAIDFQAGGYLVADLLPLVEMSFDTWSDDDADLDLLEADVERIRDSREETEVSLVLETRRGDRERRREQRLALENEYRERMGLAQIEDLGDLTDEDQTDLTLHLASEILGDLWRVQGAAMAELRQQGTGPTS
jgi:carboxyl-terminal processing protease